MCIISFNIWYLNLYSLDNHVSFFLILQTFLSCCLDPPHFLFNHFHQVLCKSLDIVCNKLHVFEVKLWGKSTTMLINMMTMKKTEMLVLHVQCICIYLLIVKLRLKWWHQWIDVKLEYPSEFKGHISHHLFETENLLAHSYMSWYGHSTIYWSFVGFRFLSPLGTSARTTHMFPP